MIIEITKLSPDGTPYEGEDPGRILNLDTDRFAHAAGPVKYSLEARLVSGELLVSGRLWASVSVRCSRCGGFFSTTLEVSSFLRAYELSGSEEIMDITDDIREDILLELPSYPACSWTEDKGVCPYSGVNLGDLRPTDQPAADIRWEMLDKFDSP